MSERQFSDPNVETFAQLFITISNAPNINRNRLRACCSALKSAARWFELPMDHVLAHPAFIRKLFERIRPTTVGVGDKRFANVRSEIMFALRYANIVDNYTYLAPLTDEWQSHCDAIGDKYIERAVSRIFRFASAQGIGPAEFDAAASQKFKEALRDGSLVKDPDTVYKNALRSWNKLGSIIEGWPGQKLDIPWRRDQYRLPAETFPLTLIADIDAYLDRQRCADPFDQDAPPRAAKESTLAAYRLDFVRMASALVHSGHDPAKVIDMRYLIDIANAEEVLKYVLDRRPDHEPRKRASKLAHLLATAAKYWVKAPAEHVAVLRGFSNRLAPRNDGLSSRSRQRLMPFREESNIVRLFLLPNRIVEAVEAGEVQGRAACLRMQQAVALSILIHCPLRIDNLTSIEFGRQLKWSGRGMSGNLMLVFEQHEVKNEYHLAFPLPKACADLIRCYVKDYRDGLLLPASNFLFPGRDPSKPKQTASFGKQITRLTHESIGFPCNPHLFRHLVHLVVLRKFPAAYGMISRVLGHKRLETTLVNYAHEATAISMRVYQELVSDASHGLWTKSKDPDLEIIANSANEGFF